MNRRELQLIAAMLRAGRWAEGRCLRASLRHRTGLRLQSHLASLLQHKGVITCHALCTPSPPHGLPQTPSAAVPRPPQLWKAAQQRCCLPACPNRTSLSWALRLLHPLGQSPGPGIRRAEWGWNCEHSCSHWAHSLPAAALRWWQVAPVNETMQPVPRQGRNLEMASHWQHVAEIVLGAELILQEIQGSSGKDADEGRELQGVSFSGANAFCAIILDFSALPTTVRLIICANVLISGEQYCCYI